MKGRDEVTTWKHLQPGEIDNGVYDASEEFGEPALIVADKPDWVMRPDTREKLRVTGQRIVTGPCLVCGATVRARVLDLENDMHVTECPACSQFIICEGCIYLRQQVHVNAGTLAFPSGHILPDFISRKRQNRCHQTGNGLRLEMQNGLSAFAFH